MGLCRGAHSTLLRTTAAKGGSIQRSTWVRRAVAIANDIHGVTDLSPKYWMWIHLENRQKWVGGVRVSAEANEQYSRVLAAYVDPSAHLMTDDAPAYDKLGKGFANHLSVNHSRGEYVREGAHINSAESVHSLLKRAVFGTYHHWSVQHLFRYLVEFDFRFNFKEAERWNKGGNGSQRFRG